MDGWTYTKTCETLNDNFQWTWSSLSLQESRAYAMVAVINNEEHIIGGVGKYTSEKISGTTTALSQIDNYKKFE